MPNDLYDDMRRLNALYEELMWSNDDELQFIIENGRIVILNKTHEEYIKKTHSVSYTHLTLPTIGYV